MKRKRVSVVNKIYLVNNPSVIRTHKEDVCAVAVWGNMLASVDNTTLVLQPRLGISQMELDHEGSELDDVRKTRLHPQTVPLSANAYPEQMAFSTDGGEVGILNYEGTLSVVSLDPKVPVQTIQIGTHGYSVGLFPWKGDEGNQNWIVVRHDRVTLVKNNCVSELCEHPNIIAASYVPDTGQFCFVDGDTKLVSYTVDGMSFRRDSERTLVSSRRWAKAFFSPDGQRIAGIETSDMRSGGVYTAAEGTNLCLFKSPRATARREDTDLIGCAFSPEGDHLWVSNETGAIDLYPIQTGGVRGSCETEPVYYEGDRPTPASIMTVGADGTLFFVCDKRVMETQVSLYR